MWLVGDDTFTDVTLDADDRDEDEDDDGDRDGSW